MKNCSVCKELKPLSQYRKGYAKCDACRYVVQKIYRETEAGKLARKKEAINARISGKKQERQKRYLLTEKSKEVKKKYETKRGQDPAFKVKQSAHKAVYYALNTGKLVRQPCFICGEIMSEAHHPSYAKDMRLAVVWLCKFHHNEIHNPVGSI